MADYDVIVIGSGPGGYVCAIRCAQLGLKTACVEGRDTLGGTCLNIGCIPSKAMLYASELYHEVADPLRDHGPDRRRRPDRRLPKMIAYKQSTVDNNTKGIEFLFKKNKIDWLKGWGRITAPGEVSVDGTAPQGQEHRHRHRLRGHAALAASPSTRRPSSAPPAPSVLAEIPKRLAVIGAGVIGLELGSVYARLGSRGHRPRIPRPDHPRHGPRDLQDPADAS